MSFQNHLLEKYNSVLTVQLEINRDIVVNTKIQTSRQRSINKLDTKSFTIYQRFKPERLHFKHQIQIQKIVLLTFMK